MVTALRTLDLTAEFAVMLWYFVTAGVEYAASVFRVPLRKLRQYIASKRL
jgi:hypothetical protein